MDVSTFEVVVFDLDGTVSDTTGCIVSAARSTAEAVQRAHPTAEAVRDKIGLPLRQMLGELLPGLSSAGLDRAVEAYQVAYVDQASRHERLFDGMAELIGRLHGAGRKLVVATGKGHSGAHNAVGRMGLTHWFHGIHGIVPGTPGKPHPAVLERALASVQADPADAVMIGDTTFDMHMAGQIGVAACGVSWGVHSPERLVAAGARWVASDVPHLSAMLGQPSS